MAKRLIPVLALGPTLVLILALLGADRARAGPPFLTDDPIPVDYRHWEVYGFSAATFAGAGGAGLAPSIEVNYGGAPNLQLHVIAPLAFNAPDEGGTRVGLGDAELGAKYRLVTQDKTGWIPDIAVFPAIEAPTGNARLGLGAGRVRAYLPIWFQKDFGPWTIDAGGGYWINPGPGQRDYGFTGILLLRQITRRLALGGEVFHQTAMTRPGRDSSGFNLGAVYDFNEHYHLLVSAGRGLTNVRDTNQISYYVAIQKTF